MIGAGRIANLLRDANYRRIWITGMCSGISRWLEMLAVGVYAFETTGSPFLVALLVILRLMPLVVLGSVVGTLADLYSPRRFMVAGMALGMTVSGTVCLLLLFGLAGYWVVAASAVASGFVWSLDMPLRRRMMGDIAGSERLVTALSFDSATNNSTRMLGPLLGGILYQNFGASGAFALTASCYAVGLFMIARVSSGSRLVEGSTGLARILTDFREGFSLALHNRDILRILLVTVVFNIWALPFISMIPVLGGDTLGLSPGWVGALGALEGMGAFVGSLTIAIVNPPIGLRRLYFFGVVAYVIFAFVAGLMTLVIPMAIAILCVGLSAGSFSSMQSTLTYSVAPPNMRSRLFGLIVIAIGTGVLGVANLGYMAEKFGAPFAVKIVSVEGLIALIVIGFGWRQLWNRQHA
jgi:MFS family permease